MRSACSLAPREKTAEQTKGPPPPLPSTITVVSFNVCGFEPSFSAPTDFLSFAAFSKEILKHEPSVICLQEVSSISTPVFCGYLLLRSTHDKSVVLLVKEEWAHHAYRLHVSAPAVLSQINFSSKTGVEQSIVFGSCHLAPFKANASKRMDQTTSVVRAVPENHPFVFAGDFNMRAVEDENVEGLGFQDVWKEAGMEYSQKFTWDSVDRTKQEGGSYNRYYKTCYPFNCRFDRVYFKQSTNKMLTVKHFSLIGNKPLTNSKHFLSDHFGMVATFDIR
jgi:endonuclease/exonuclease/phosphatase family metal-dependent hydrolase